MTEKENIRMIKYMDKACKKMSEDGKYPENIDDRIVFDRAVSKVIKKELKKSLRADTNRKLSGELIVEGSKKGCNRQILLNTKDGDSFKVEFYATSQNTNNGVYDIWKNNDKTLLQTLFESTPQYTKQKKFSDFYSEIKTYLESQNLEQEINNDIDF